MKSKYWIATRGIGFYKDLRYELTQPALDFLYPLADEAGIRRNWDQAEEAFSFLLANLYHADIIDEPIFYSRSPNAFSIERERYGYDFYRYALIIRLIDAMYQHGLVQGVKGRKISGGRNRPSKIWATPMLKGLLNDLGGAVSIKRSPEVLYLKDEDKRLAPYQDTTMTRRMRHGINTVNEMLGSLKIAFGFQYRDLSDRPQARINKLMKLRSLTLSSQIDIHNSSTILTVHQDSSHYLTSRGHTTKYYTVYDHDAFIGNELNGLWVNGEINPDANFLRRVFNVDWHQGGRYYQAPHITLPSSCRASITINGEPCVELDYSGLHIRMLYHRFGIDYRDECYVYDKGDTDHKDERKRIKLASLIVINSDDRGRAIRAIHNECRKKGLHYPTGQFGQYRALVDAFERFHEPIRASFLKGKGLGLQYQDSTIMSAILQRMTDRGMPALPVHDSVVCPVRHEDYLRQAMMEEYEKVMDFTPIVDKKQSISAPSATS